jgi:hypothetical protein
VGSDASKKVKGRKAHALVGTEGLPLRVIVHSAAIQDSSPSAGSLLWACARLELSPIASLYYLRRITECIVLGIEAETRRILAPRS